MGGYLLVEQLNLVSMETEQVTGALWQMVYLSTLLQQVCKVLHGFKVWPRPADAIMSTQDVSQRVTYLDKSNPHGCQRFTVRWYELLAMLVRDPPEIGENIAGIRHRHIAILMMNPHWTTLGK